jgi:hypothetical protein
VSEGPQDRYEPLPGLLAIPGFLYRKLGPGGRMVAKVSAAIALAGLVVAAIVLVPQIRDTKHENAARDRRERVAAERAERRRLIAEQRPRSARSELAPATTPARRHRLLLQIEAGIVRDARARVRAGSLKPPPPRYATCEALPGERPRARVSRLSCTAVTSEVRGQGGARGVIGHPFRARVDYRSGRYAWCKVSGHAGEGSYVRPASVPVPRACGG